MCTSCRCGNIAYCTKAGGKHAQIRSEVQQQRNRLDTREWALSKLAPRKYGDRVEHDHKSGNDFQPAILIQVSGGEREDDAKLIEGD